MAGLMGNAAPPGQPPAGGQPPPAAPTEMETSVSPEEQAQYDQFVTNAMSIMNDKKGAKKVLKAIDSGDNPVNGLANAVVAIIMRVEDSAKEGGKEISGDVLMHGGAEILEQAADLSEQAGGHAFTEEELEQATYVAMDLYRDGRGDNIDKEAQGESMNELQAAEADGSLEQELPGLAEHSQQSLPPAVGGDSPPPQKGLTG